MWGDWVAHRTSKTGAPADHSKLWVQHCAGRCSESPHIGPGLGRIGVATVR